MPDRFLIHTLGCKANAYDSQLLRQDLVGRGWQAAAPGEPADLVVVNSCTVTEEADRQSRKTASRLGRRHPRARVVITGCGAEVDPRRYAATPGVHAVVGHRDTRRLWSATLEPGRDDPSGEGRDAPGGAGGPRRPRHDPAQTWPAPAAAFLTPEPSAVRTRVFLKVQEGCDAFCTFCIIPYARGPARSLSPPELTRQVQAIVAQGGREVVLTGTALGDYGADLGLDQGLETLVAALLQETTVERLRLGSLDPREITPRLLKLMEREPRLCPHLHVSLQSASGVVLKRMKRRYGEQDVVRCLESIDALGGRLDEHQGLPGGVFVGMDVIAGFPGETDAEFEAARARLAALPWHRLHVFPYSEREGTAATRLDQRVAPAVRRERVRSLMSLSNQRMKAQHLAIAERGATVEVLVESPTRPAGAPTDGAWSVGHTTNYLRVLVAGRHAPNTSVQARVVDVSPDLRAGLVSLVAHRPPRSTP